MGKLVVRRIVFGLLALIGSSFFIFVFTDLMPGDFATAVLGQSFSLQTAEVIREKLGLYLPLLSRYLLWLGDAIRGEFGISWSGYEITPVIEVRMKRSLWLAMVTGMAAFPLAILLGVFSALNRFNYRDRAAVIANTVMLSVPEFLVGYTLVGVFAIAFPIFPSLALFHDDDPVLSKLYSVTLPVITLSLVSIPPVMRIVRASLINTLNSDYVELAILKGISPFRIMIAHVLPNNIGPIINAVTLGFAHLIAGIVIVEIVFVFPGIGSLFINSLSVRDVPIIQACGVILSGCYIFLIMIADLIAIMSSPRLLARQKMAIFHPGHVKKGFKYATAVFIAGLCVYLAQSIPESPPQALQRMIATQDQPDIGQDRTYATMDELLSLEEFPNSPVHNLNFMPLGQVSNPAHQFNGGLEIAPNKILGQQAGGLPRYGFGVFPETLVEFVTYGNRLIPLEKGFLDTGDNDWAMLVGPGRLWSEKSDKNFTRASFPFALVNKNGAATHQGIAMFVFNDKSVSNLRYQIVQESSPGRRFSAWGQTAMNFTRKTGIPKEKVISELIRFSESDFVHLPWSDLVNSHGENQLSRFDGIYHQGNITTSGLIMDNIIYQKPCQTRFGDYPFCESMRHSVYSVTKTLGAALTLARLAQKYGDEVLQANILDYVNLTPDHDGWKDVTFLHALNMATGIGDLQPRNVNAYVDSDENEEASARVFREVTSLGKIREISRFNSHAWGPGKVLRYRTADTFVLTYAMDRFLKSREGDHAMLWDMMNREVFQPIGIPYLPVVHTRDRELRNRIPKLGSAMIPTINDIAKIVRLLRNEGKHEGSQLLSRKVVIQMMDVQSDSGLPSGWKYREGGEARYNMSMWLVPYQSIQGCSITMTAMVGAGGNYVIPVRNGITAFRFADRYEDHPGTYDSFQMRRSVDSIKSVCDAN